MQYNNKKNNRNLVTWINQENFVEVGHTHDPSQLVRP